MLITRHRFLLHIGTGLSIFISSAILSQPDGIAPFNNETVLRNFSDALITRIGDADLTAAKNLAIKNSHRDDDITQHNLNEVFDSLGQHLANSEPLKVEFVQESKFGRSFIRHQYSLNRPLKHSLEHPREQSWQALRCMLTYRRKTDGWRLNQLWCNGVH